jgi:hypothetical protein
MSRYEVIHIDKGLAFGSDRACGEFLMIWKRPTDPKERNNPISEMPGPDNVIVDLDKLDPTFDRDMMLRLISEHGFTLSELENAKYKGIPHIFINNLIQEDK